MNQERFKKLPSLFSASGLFLLAGIGLWLTLVISGDLTAGLRMLLPGAGEELLGLLVSIVYYLPFLILPVTMWGVTHKGAQSALRLNPIRPGDMLRAAIIALLSLMIVQNITMVWMILLQKLGLNVFTTEYVRPANSTELMLSAIAAAVVAPLGEELLFRGAMLSAWERKGPKAAVLITAVLFAMQHGSLAGMPGEIFGGIVLALLVLYSNSIYAGLAFHSVYNAGNVMMNYISSAAETTAAEEALMRSDLLAYVGGYSSVLILLVNIALDLAIIVMLTRRMRARYVIRRAFERVLPGSPEPKSVEELRELMNQTPETDKTPMGAGTVIVLLAGIVSCAGMYVIDILSMLGG